MTIYIDLAIFQQLTCLPRITLLNSEKHLVPMFSDKRWSPCSYRFVLMKKKKKPFLSVLSLFLFAFFSSLHAWPCPSLSGFFAKVRFDFPVEFLLGSLERIWHKMNPFAENLSLITVSKLVCDLGRALNIPKKTKRNTIIHLLGISIFYSLKVNGFLKGSEIESCINP